MTVEDSKDDIFGYEYLDALTTYISVRDALDNLAEQVDYLNGKIEFRKLRYIRLQFNDLHYGLEDFIHNGGKNKEQQVEQLKEIKRVLNQIIKNNKPQGEQKEALLKLIQIIKVKLEEIQSVENVVIDTQDKAKKVQP